MKTIWVTGANGQLPSEIKILSSQFSGCRFLFTNREQVPIENYEAVSIFFQQEAIDIVINCAAYTAVDKAESDRDRAFAINAYAVEDLAKTSLKKNATFIHVSTDYVYDGRKSEPLKESDPTGPVNVYGESKLKGEQLALAANPGSIIIRTSWVYSSFGNNFVKTMMRLFSEKKEINVVNDQVGCPTYAADLAKTILRFVNRIAKGEKFAGIYNYSNSGATTWYEFAKEISSDVGSACIINPVPTSSFPTPAKRPLYSLMDTSKISDALQMAIPDWKESLKVCIRRIQTA